MGDRAQPQAAADGLAAAASAAWVASVRERFDPERLKPLLALVPPSGFRADCLTGLARGDEPFDVAMDLITRLPEEMWNQDLRSLGTTRARADELAKLNGSAGRERAVELLREYHAFAIAPFANELRGMALADIDRRSHELASGGISELFAHLHPDLRLGPEGLLVEGDHGVDRLPKRLLDGGLVLVPSVFVWPGVATYLLNGFAPTVAYAAIGVGNFVRREGRHSKPLSDLLGATRARILLELELPMTTTQVVGLLRLAPATANAHLKTLADSGLATAYRDGRAVVYRPTALGDSLASQP